MNGAVYSPENDETNIVAPIAPTTPSPPNTSAVLQPTITMNASFQRLSITLKMLDQDCATSLVQSPSDGFV